VGIAFGFGAQNLVKDFISGIFMLLEDQYGVGDVIDMGEASGTVEGVGLRVTRLRAVDGTVWYVRNGEVVRVGNSSHGWARTVLDVPVAYGEDSERARALIETVARELAADPEWSEHVLEDPEVWGIEEVTAAAFVFRLVVKTEPLQQWAIARELRERIMRTFEAEGVQIAKSQPA
jgi:small conductance mechanosensitive channel